MKYKLLAIMIMGTISGGIGYYVYGVSGLLSGFAAVFIAGWLIYRFSSYGRAWNTIKFFTHPVLAAALIGFTGFLVLVVGSNSFEFSVTLAAGLAALGAVLGMFMFMFWNP